MTGFGRLGGERIAGATVHVPRGGPWYADVDLETDPELEGRVTLALGELELSGTIVARHAGAHARQRRVRLVAGAGAWGTLLPARAYHNDAGVSARLVVDDAVAAIGERLGTFTVAAATVGRDYVRQAGPASRVLEDTLGGACWWVDFDGVTHVGPREDVPAEAPAYEVLDYDPRSRLVTLAVDDLRAILIGSVLSSPRLVEPQTVRELELFVVESGLRVRAWCGGSASSRGRLQDALRQAVDRRVDRKLWGCWRYRVVRMAGDRAELQAVRQAAGLPDVLPISQWPGLAGAHAELAPSAEVLVQFVEGDRTQPIVTHFAGKDGVGWTPVNLTLDASAIVKLGKDAASFAAKADAVLDRLTTIVTGFNTHVHSGGTLGGGLTGVPQATLATPASVAAAKVQVQ